jgi:nitric oxide dioxygenase
MTAAASALRLPQPDLDARSGLTSEHAEIVRASLGLVGKNIGAIASRFYTRMFRAHPELLADTFNRGNQAQGAQQKALASAVATYAGILVTPDAPSPASLLSRIGHKHVSLGITEDQYDIVHEHLMAAILEVLGEAVVTPDVAEAWSAVYWHMAGTLIAFEKEMYAEAGVVPGDVFREAVVTRRIRESSEVVGFELQAPHDADPLPGFVPGQYISVGVRLADGARQLRQYSLTDVAGEGRWRIAVRRIDADAGSPKGEVSTWLHENLQEGDRLQVTLPAGDLALDTADDSPVVLASAGIGATPMLGMLRHIAAQQPWRQVLVLHADGDSADAALVADLIEAVGALPEGSGSRLSLWFSRTMETDPLEGREDAGVDGRLSAAPGRMRIESSDLPAGAEVYLCGSSRFLRGARAQLLEAGAERSRIHYELFAPDEWAMSAG